jgi:UDP-2,3-diacylglucosamine pyrophosphatase LpxH
MAVSLRYRAVFISDLHLGSTSAHAEAVGDFLKRVDCETLYLVGDIVDMWRLKQRWWWPESHNRVVRRILKLAKQGTKVVYVPGNHDDAARQYAGLNFGGVEIQRDAVHTTLDGKRLLVIHGDEADVVVCHHRVLSTVGSVAYDNLVSVSRHYSKVRTMLGQPHWSLSQYVKLRVKKACMHIARFEETIAELARRGGYDGVVCGHIHKAEKRTGADMAYFNCGDWVESGTALVENLDGSMQIIDGIAMVQALKTKHPASYLDEPETVGSTRDITDDELAMLGAIQL